MTSDKRHDDEVRALDRPGAGRESLVPASYAEKAMSSLLRLHEDLVEEKEKRIDLYRRLMEREQSLAEMRAYMKLLEGELARRGFDPTRYAIDPASAPVPTAEKHQAVAAAVARERAPAPAAAEPQAADQQRRPVTQQQTAPPQQPTPAYPTGPARRAVPPPPGSPASRQAPAPPPRPVAQGESLGSPVIAWTPGPGPGPGTIR